MKPEYQAAVMKKYGFMDWDSVLAAIGHGALKEGQIANRMQELYEKDHPKVMTNEEVLASIAENNANQAKQMHPHSKNGIVVRGFMMWQYVFPNAALLCPGMRSSAL